MDTNNLHPAYFKPVQIPQRTQLRRLHLLKHVNLSGKGLEIGPYNSPILYKSETNISYLDWKSREQLIAESSPTDEVDSIPETDYLVASNDYKQYVTDTFDYIIANHVLEHVPDFIQWFSNISALLNPDGILFLALPDKKFTYDKYRQNTSLSHILNDYYEGVQTISQEHILEQAIYYDLTFIGKPMVVSERLDRNRIEAVISQGYQSWMIGYHCHIFQSETVLDTVFKPLTSMGYIDLEIIEFVPAVGLHYGEMMIIFKKPSPILPKKPVDLSSFYSTNSQANTDQLTLNQIDHVMPISILMSIKKSKFVQKYVKPLLQKKQKVWP